MKLIKINYLTYYFLILFFMCGLIKTALIIFTIVIFHELGHVVAAKINKHKIINITIYPFGGITKLEKDLNSPLKKDFFLAINGVVFQLILYFIFLKLNSLSLITNKTFYIFSEYNRLIMLFNLLPIEPLDGSNIFEVFLNKFFPYKKSLYIKIGCSFIFLIVFLLFNLEYSINNYMIMIFLIFKILELKKNIEPLYNRFLLERCLNSYEYKKIKNDKLVDLKKIKKNVFYYFWDKNKWMSEKTLLKNKFNL